MAVRRNSDALKAANPLPDGENQILELFRRCETDRIGNIQCSGAPIHHRLEDLAQELRVRSGSVFWRELNVLAKRFGQTNCITRLFDTLLAGNLELVFEMNVGGCEKHVDARQGGMSQRLPRPLDVLTPCSSQSSNDGPANCGGNRLHSLAI